MMYSLYLRPAIYFEVSDSQRIGIRFSFKYRHSTLQLVWRCLNDRGCVEDSCCHDPVETRKTCVKKRMDFYQKNDD